MSFGEDIESHPTGGGDLTALGPGDGNQQTAVIKIELKHYLRRRLIVQRSIVPRNKYA